MPGPRMSKMGLAGHTRSKSHFQNRIFSVIRELAETGGGRHGGGGRGETRGGHDRGINVLYLENPVLS